MKKQATLDVIEAKIEDVVTSGLNPRKHFDKHRMEELAHSIKNMGILEPLIARKKGNQYELVAGERRLRAAQQLNMQTVPIWVREIADKEVLEVMFVENLERASLLPLEEAEALDGMIKAGSNIEDLSQRLGRSKHWIKDRIKLLILPSSIKKMLNDQDIPIEGALECTKFADSTVLDTIAQDLVDEHKSAGSSGEKMQVSDVLMTIDQAIGRLPDAKGGVLNFDTLNNSFGSEWCKHFDKKECKGCKDRVKHKAAYGGTVEICLNSECFGPKVKAAKEKAKTKKQKEKEEGGDEVDYTRMSSARDLSHAAFDTDVCKKCPDRKKGNKYGKKAFLCIRHQCYNKMEKEAQDIREEQDETVQATIKVNIDNMLKRMETDLGGVSSSLLRMTLLAVIQGWNIDDTLKSLRPKGSEEDPAIAVSKLPGAELARAILYEVKGMVMEQWVEDTDNLDTLVKVMPELLEGCVLKPSDLVPPKCEPLPKEKSADKPKKGADDAGTPTD